MESQKNKTEKTDAAKKKFTSKQLVAWAGIFLLIFLYLITLFAAVFDNSSSKRLFALCLYATVAIPLLIWIYAWIFQKISERRKDLDD